MTIQLPPYGRAVRLLGWAVVFAIASHGAARVEALEIDFWAVMSSVEDVTMYKGLADSFKEETGITVKITPLGWGDYQTKYFAAMAAGLPPDVGVTNLGGAVDYGIVGGTLDLLRAFPGEAEDLAGSIFPSLHAQNSFRGKLFGLPTELITNAIYYRTDIFAKLGIKAPRTWSEYRKAMRLLEANGYHHGMLWPRGEQWALSLYTMPYGIPAFSWSSSGAPVVNWENPKYQQGIAFALDQWCMHDLPSVKLGNRAIGLFKSDEPENGMPMFVDIINTYSKLPILAPEIDGNWDILPWPKADDGNEYNVMGGTSYAIFSKSRHKREAFEWLKYLNRLESQQRIILERANRGENSVFTLSPVMAVWGPENASFWQRPELAKSKRLIEVMTGVVKTFGTIESVHGALDAGRLEQHLIDRAQMLATKELNDVAQRHGISRWELIQAFAQGKFIEDKQAIDNRMQDLIHNEYKTIAVEAQGIITRETKYYDQRFGNVINELEDYEKRFDILSYVKAFVVTLLCAFTALVLLYRPMRTRYISYLFISLPLFLVAVFTFVPAITALALSFTEYHPVLPLSSAKWCALKQYTDILQSGELLDCISRTLLYILLTLPVTMALSLLLSSLLNNKLRGERFWRFIYFSPLVTSAISVSLIFTQIYAGTASGWLNALGLKVGLLSDPVDWLNEESTFLYCVILLAIWGGLPFQTLIFLAGLQQVPKQLYESAALDGAGWVRQFWNISLPSLRPQILFVAITGVIGGFQVFETIFMLAGGTGDAKLGFGPNDAGMTMVPLVYYNGFEVYKMGRASAVACVLFVLILVLTMLQFRFFADKKAEQ